MVACMHASIGPYLYLILMQPKADNHTYMYTDIDTMVCRVVSDIDVFGLGIPNLKL